ncbi:hypothetical protein [Photobacterium phosphoreum]|uniref:hypothetical protein n=1 Tax=Photobacterium phosphoreum TaxID=659 RepID=UPI000D1832D4|nr:hypothetical protein [Photobacterium phosphoreum]PSU35406.1 hypothetical protein CTM85_17085 [Photobacterium phosphoreum]
MELFLYHIEDGRFCFKQRANMDNKGHVIFPAYSTPIEPPQENLNSQAYWAYLDNNGQVPRLHCQGHWQVKKEKVAVTVYNIKTLASKDIADISDIEKDYTEQKPVTVFDEWIAGQWVTNLEKQYQYDYNQVDDVRRALFTQYVDPLLAEASIKKTQDLKEESALYVQQALALRQKIQDENPWPLLPQESANGME